ncbi:MULTISPECIES: RBBP9/YdeN family alpha/beta hydrolase [Methylorubrum]|uniref:RBBP9/YdeN family alpha/beta hydrolase n=1 Tax=Methylorubrum TaxID=2282523 RepID=UPI00209D18CC|nr:MULTISPECIES: alpha/beta hydrolase [Methylorubrum]MCP1547717.1 putative alpha/beta hydrolase family esterase [Methylorubrum zatmanii]MCP1555667.1 putative alpha/beta hydrolase family esterase [Methylorubrum extorquens]MCP1578020.1 putative alpha/beta hydrolase family esterase [Methylorubrum extorquens]
MKTADCDILILPGYAGSEEEHWQARWAARLKTARIVAQDDWHRPDPEAWRARVAEAVAAATRPVILIAHSLGVVAAVEAAPRFPEGVVRGALLVAFPDIEAGADLPESVRAFGPVPRDPLPFPSLLVASRTDPHCTYERAEDYAYAWGSALVDAGEAGHINVASGHGPWPEGLMRLAGFLAPL